jgi:hypothetical protein
VSPFTYPINWLLEMLHMWRVRRRQQFLDNFNQCESPDGAVTTQVYRQLGTPFLLLPL